MTGNPERDTNDFPLFTLHNGSTMDEYMTVDPPAPRTFLASDRLLRDVQARFMTVSGKSGEYVTLHVRPADLRYVISETGDERFLRLTLVEDL